jgi:hypothetical protein
MNIKGEHGSIEFRYNHVKRCLEVDFYPGCQRGGYNINITSGGRQLMKEILPLLTADDADLLLEVLNSIKSQGELF